LPTPGVRPAALRATRSGRRVTTSPLQRARALVKGDMDAWMLPRIAISNSILQCGRQTFAPGKTQLWCAKNALQPVAPKPAKTGTQIKIAFVIDTITEWEGGTERQLHALIRMLDRTQFQPELCFLLPTGELPPETLPCRTQWICRDKTDQPSSIVVRLFRLTRMLRQMRPQIVQTFFNEGIFLGILAARLSGVPRVVGSARNAGHWKKPAIASPFAALPDWLIIGNAIPVRFGNT